MKPGYKQSEVGAIPDEWDVIPLAELFAFRNGVNADKASYGRGVFFVNVLEPITYSHIYGPEITGRVTLPESVIASYAVRRGDVLFNRTSETQEEVALAATYLGAERVVFGGFVIRGRPIDQRLDPVYSGYALRAPFIRSQIIPMGQGAVRANVGQRNLGLVVAPLPPLAEQRAIAEALSDVDALLGALDRLIAKKRNLKQAAIQQLLTGETRLPGFSGDREVKRLGDVAIIRDGTHQTPRYVEFGIPFYSVEHVTSGDFKNTKYISSEEHRFLSRTSKIERGDILMTRIGSIGDCKLIDWDADASFYVSLALLKIKSGYSAAYVAHYSKSTAFQREVELHSLQSAIPKKINLGPISEVKVEFPPFAEQVAIAELLNEMDAELAALEQRRDKTRALKQGMMQELLTGRTRLVSPEPVHA